MPSSNSTSDFDRLRAENPELGFALYAVDPGGDVILEVNTPAGDWFSFRARSAVEVIAQAFPPPLSFDIFS